MTFSKPVFLLLGLGVFSTATLAQTLPEAAKTSLEKAYKTEDAFIIDATAQAVAARYNLAPSQVEAYLSYLEQAPQRAARQQRAREQHATFFTPKLWSGEVEGSFVHNTGNTDSEDMRAAVSAKRETTASTTKLAASAQFAEEDDVRTEEAYAVNGEYQHNLSPRDFVYADGAYVNDQFSGYAYQMTETVGYGYRIIKREDMSLDAKLGVGMRHSKADVDGADTQTEAVLKPEANYTWQITEGLSFEENAQATIGEDYTELLSETALKTQVYENWFLKAAFEVEHTTEVPEGAQKTDTTTLLSVVYSF